MNVLIAIAAKLIERFLVWFVQVMTLVYQDKLEDKQQKKRAEKNSKLVDQAKTPEERRRHVEDLLNDE